MGSLDVPGFWLRQTGGNISAPGQGKLEKPLGCSSDAFGLGCLLRDCLSPLTWGRAIRMAQMLAGVSAIQADVRALTISLMWGSPWGLWSGLQVSTDGEELSPSACTGASAAMSRALLEPVGRISPDPL